MRSPKPRPSLPPSPPLPSKRTNYVTTSPLLIALRQLVNPDGDEQYNADHDTLPEHRHAADDQRILNKGHKQDPQKRAWDRTYAARQAGPTQDGRRDRPQLGSYSGQYHCIAQSRGEQ